MSINLEVSLAEALDKLSILDIKMNKINDLRRIHVEKEFNYLFSSLEKYLINYSYFYKILRKINLDIWELQDVLRNENSNKSNFYIICDEILNLNDARYLAKKKINEIGNSNFKEQKGYNLRCINFYINTTSSMNDYINSIIRYFSFYYDIVYLYIQNEDNIDFYNLFSDDPFIRCNEQTIENSDYDFIKINNYEVEKKFTHSYFLNKLNNNNNDKDKNNEFKNKSLFEIPENIYKLYNELNLDIKIYTDYKK